MISAMLLIAVVGCPAPQPPNTTQTISGPIMGTTFEVKIVHPGDAAEPPPEGLPEAVTAILSDIDGKMSTYNPESEISRFNAWASTDPFPISAETAAVVVEAMVLADTTSGALDVTVGPLVRAYGFGADEVAEWPSDEEVAALVAAIGVEQLSLLEGEEAALRKGQPELEVDLSAVAKGYAVDRVAEELRARGLDRFMVEVGGEVRAEGRNAERNTWRLGIERPDATRGRVQRVIPLKGAALATSGDYRNYREIDGERFSHLLDPRTGRPIGHRLASVSVIAETCVRADGLATALMVLGEGEGLALAESLDLAALFLVRDDDGGFREVESSAFTRRVALSDAS
ncbi:MAG: FAD:protein FMN transferase [Acidobacteriota bacterium]